MTYENSIKRRQDAMTGSNIQYRDPESVIVQGRRSKSELRGMWTPFKKKEV